MFWTPLAGAFDELGAAGGFGAAIGVGWGAWNWPAQGGGKP
jgi:hypothetical protein